MSETDTRQHIDAEDVDGSLLDSLQRRERNMELQICVHAPGTIVTYNPANSTAVVQLGFLKVLDTELGDVPRPPILIPDVRVMWDQGSGGASYDTRPLLPGDTGELSFHDRALGEWYAKGQSPDPIDGRAHDIADATFRPGLAPDATALKGTDMTARVIEAPLIKLGEDAAPVTGQLALAKALHQYLVDIVNAATPGTSDGGLALKSSLLLALAAMPFTNFATTKTVAE